MLLATPSPDPRRLMKAPARTTLSPKGERSCEKIKNERKFLTN
jgi:hypothetical protein